MTPITYEELRKYLKFLLDAHEKHDTTSKEIFRQKGRTPYPTHPIFAAQSVLVDRRVPWEERRLGYYALLLHDVLENTSLELPDWVEEEVKKRVELLTFNEGTKEEKLRALETRPIYIKYLVLADTLSNMYEEHISEHNRDTVMKIVRYLIDELSEQYRDSTVVALVKHLLEVTDWSGADEDSD